MSKAVRGTRKPIESTGTAVTLKDAVNETRKQNGNAATAATLKDEKANTVGRTKKSIRHQLETYSANTRGAMASGATTTQEGRYWRKRKRWTRSAEPSSSRWKREEMP